MIDLGIVKPGKTLYLPWGTFAAATGAPSAMTNLAVGDIQIYRDGGVTQRASTTGFTLLDTDGQDFDGLTGVNGISIDLSSDADAGFYRAGSTYWVVISDVTVDSQTLRFPLATFTIGLPSAVLNTWIASLTSQTVFTLNEGPTEDDALNGCVIYFHDKASAQQCGHAIVLDYVGSSKTVTLQTAPQFTLTTGDNTMVMPARLWNPAWDAEVQSECDDAILGRNLHGLVAGSASTTALGTTTTAIASGLTQGDDFWNGMLLIFSTGSSSGQARLITDFDAATDTVTFWPPASAAIAAGVTFRLLPFVPALDLLMANHTVAGTLGKLLNDNLDATVSSRSTQTSVDNVQADTDNIQTRLPAALVSGRMDSSVGAMANDTITAAAIAADAGTEIKDAVLGGAVPGAHGAGTLGKVVGDNLNATVGSRSTQASVDSVQADTNDIQTRLPTALVGGRMDSDAVAVNGSTEAATRMQEAADTIVTGTADSGATTTSIPCKTLSPAADELDQFKSRVLIFSRNTSQTRLRGKVADITGSSTSGGAAGCTLTVTGLTTAPDEDAIFVIV